MARTSLKALEIPEGVTLENNQGVINFPVKVITKGLLPLQES